MRLRVSVEVQVEDYEEVRGVCEQIGVLLEPIGDARVLSVTPILGERENKIGRGPYKNVMLTDREMILLVNKFGNRAHELVRVFSIKLYQKGYRFRDHCAMILEWESKEQVKPECGVAQSFDVDEFFRANIERGIQK